MKDVRNKQLQNKLNKLGIKDVVLNFDNGYVSVWSEDDLTDTILHYADNTIETRAFYDYTIDEWFEMIKDIFDDGLESYERGKEYDNYPIIKIGNKTKKLEEDFDRESVIKSMRDCFEYSEAQHSQIGIFWYDVNKDELFGVNKEDAEHCNFVPSSDGDDIRSYGRLHKDIWKKEQYRGKDKRFVGDYTKIPRGRVSQYKNKGFVVFVGDWIDDYPSVKADIIYEFELPSDVEFRKDHHWNLGNGWSDELI